MKVFIFFGFLSFLGFANHISAADEFLLADLDSSLVKERLRRIYGEFNLRAAGDWKVTEGGRSEIWKWTDKGWSCPVDQKSICSELVPLSLRWWVQTRSWLTAWNPKRKLGLEFGRAEDLQRPVHVAPSPDSKDAATDEETEEVKAFAGKKTANEVWEWESTSGVPVKIHISLRDQRIVRIDGDKWTEYLDWFQKRPGSVPELDRIVIDQNGTQTVMTRQR